MNVGIRVKLNTLTSDLEADIKRIEEIWSDGLQRFGGPFLAGNSFTAADAFFAPVVFRIRTYNLPISKTAQSYCNLILSLPGMIDWENTALNETLRDKSHEIDITNYGVIMEDFRLNK